MVKINSSSKTQNANNTPNETNATLGPCPCDSGQAYSACCEPLLRGLKKAQSAEQLMRSRYSAYSNSDIAYLLQSTLPIQQPHLNIPAMEKAVRQTQWTGLQIINTSAGLNQDQEGWVEFVAHYQENNQHNKHHEKSYFKKQDHQWYFVYPMQELLNQNLKIGRNEPCLCGSNKKFKKCCGNEKILGRGN